MTGIPTNGPLVADSLVLRYGTVSALNNCSADFPGSDCSPSLAPMALGSRRSLTLLPGSLLRQAVASP